MITCGWNISEHTTNSMEKRSSWKAYSHSASQ